MNNISWLVIAIALLILHYVKPDLVLLFIVPCVVLVFQCLFSLEDVGKMWIRWKNEEAITWDAGYCLDVLT